MPVLYSGRNPMEGKIVKFIENPEEEENADGKRGHLAAIGTSVYHAGVYEKYIKRGFDIVLSLVGLIVLSPVFLILIIWIVIDDPGPVFFTQKRIGKNKRYFKIHKFRSMKMSTPKNMPTHMVDDPSRYITKAGKFIRLHSLDELPQLWDILVGNMSVVGPRPALWNQDYLIACRDEYGANDVKPGLTGWAQINGRDKIDIPVKASYDGAYVKSLREGRGFMMDIRCFFGSLQVFAKDDDMVEGNMDDMKGNIR